MKKLLSSFKYLYYPGIPVLIVTIGFLQMYYREYIMALMSLISASILFLLGRLSFLLKDLSKDLKDIQKENKQVSMELEDCTNIAKDMNKILTGLNNVIGTIPDSDDIWKDYRMKMENLLHAI